MPKYPYRVLGSFLDRIFRNNLNNNFTDIQSDLEEQKGRVDNLIISNPQPSEVQDARGGFTVLRERFDAVDEQLAQIVSQVPNAKADGWTDDSGAIQTVLNSLPNGGTVLLTNKTYRILSTLVIPAKVKLKLDKGASIRIGADVHGVQLKKNSSIEGGTIWYDFSNPTKSCIYIDDSEQFGTSYHNTNIKNIKLESGGIGIYFYCKVSTGYISSVTVQNVNIGYCTTGIKLQADNPVSGNTWVNGNIFDQITITGAQYFLYLASQDNAKSAVAGNIFKGLNFQADSSTSPQRYIYCSGQWNYFEGTMWDWSNQSLQATSIEFTSIASYNAVKTVRPTSEFLNSGANNYLQSPYNPAFGLQDSSGYINSPIGIGGNQDITLKSNSGSWAWIDNPNGTVRITSGGSKGSINGLLVNGSNVQTSHSTLDDGAGNMTVHASLSFVTVSSTNALNNSLFIDSADNKLKFKDNAGTVTIIAS